MLPGLFNRALTGLLDMLVNGLRWLVGLILSSSLNFVTQTPAGVSYDHPTVVALSGRIRAVANAALALIVLWGGFNIILRRHLAASYHTAMELGPRLIVGALLVNTSHWWTRLVVDANNALCQVVGATSLPFWERVTTVGNPEVQARLDLYGTLLYLIACLLLVIQMLVRLALVDVLLVVAPLGLACWVLPQTQGWARLWSSTFTGAVFVQFAQVVALALGGQLLVQLAPSGIDTMAVTPFLGFAALWLALRIPSLIAVEFTQVFPRPPVLGSGNRPATAATAKAQGRQMVLKGFERFVR
ncbi:MAG TPA: conjugal transfer protein TrbL family protein [Chloroflexota bacterium]